MVLADGLTLLSDSPLLRDNSHQMVLWEAVLLLRRRYHHRRQAEGPRSLLSPRMPKLARSVTKEGAFPLQTSLLSLQTLKCPQRPLVAEHARIRIVRPLVFSLAYRATLPALPPPRSRLLAVLGPPSYIKSFPSRYAAQSHRNDIERLLYVGFLPP